MPKKIIDSVERKRKPEYRCQKLCRLRGVEPLRRERREGKARPLPCPNGLPCLLRLRSNSAPLACDTIDDISTTGVKNPNV